MNVTPAGNLPIGLPPGVFVMGHSRLLASLVVLAYVATSDALLFSVQPGPPFIYIEVGSNTQTIDTVTFTVPTGPGAGNGTPFVGAPVIPITVLGYSGGNQSNYRITMNSAAGLSSPTGARIPFSEFSWTTRDGDIPPGNSTTPPTNCCSSTTGVAIARAVSPIT